MQAPTYVSIGRFITDIKSHLQRWGVEENTSEEVVDHEYVAIDFNLLPPMPNYEAPEAVLSNHGNPVYEQP